jgi:phosphate transport system protein
LVKIYKYENNIGEKLMLKEKIIELKEHIVSQANNVEIMIVDCINGFLKKDKELLSKVINEDEIKINKNEVKIEKLYTDIFVRYQTEAKDLRTVLMISKMNIDLERVADQCVNIAESALFLIDKPSVKPIIDIPRMSEIAKNMLIDSINSFIDEDEELAKKVCLRDEEVDVLNEQILRELITYMACDPKTVERSLHLIRISHNIEKIADLATNIAEEAVFIVSGKIIKHHRLEKNSK